MPAAAATATSLTAAANSDVVTRTRPDAMARDRHNQRSLGAKLNSAVKKARVLMVGAGGIGCELLKNLVLSGFGDIHIVDLDTIDLSNLNRQFLFRYEHIKKPKALVAKEAAKIFNPNVKITAHHANIKDAQFGVDWFRGFTIIFNALDNLDARRHVNRMCLAADIPLIESGTTGFNGQVQVIKKDATACYDCTPKDTPKSFPVCTIRSTPSQPIHCIVWGKSYLLNEVFGASEEAAAFDHSADGENAKEIEELERESRALRKIKDSIGTGDFTQMLFDKVFNSDIERLRSMADMWKSRKPPEPLQYDDVLSRATGAIACREAILRDGQRIWTLEESVVVFMDSLDRLSKRMRDMRKGHDPSMPDPVITFDKDDEDTLDFVASSANIRSSIFGIERKSRFDIKQMAGNIIPAIATTNAIVAGLCVLQAFKVLNKNLEEVKEVFLTPFAPFRLLASDKSRGPNPQCPVCSVFQTRAHVDLSRATLQDLVDDFLRLGLGYGDKDIAVNNEAGILYDADEQENLCKKLSDLGIKQDSFITVIDEDDDDPFVNVVISIQESDGSFEKAIRGTDGDQVPQIPRKPKESAQPESQRVAQLNGKHSLQLVEPENRSLKRSRATEDGELMSETKKIKIKSAQPQEEDDDVVLVEDSGGAIVIDD